MRTLAIKAAVFTILVGGTAAAQSQDPTDLFFALIRRDHATVLALIERIETGPATRQHLQQLEAALVPHLEGEEAAFYPALARAGAGELAKQAAARHREATVVLREIMRMAPADPELPIHVATLKQMLQDHMNLEEETIFPEARRLISDQQFQRILVDFQVAKQLTERVFEGP